MLNWHGIFAASSAVAAAQLVRPCVQACQFMLVASVLGPAQLGTFTAASAVGLILSPLAGAGSAHLVVRDIAAFQMQPGVALSRALPPIIAVGSALAAVATVPVAAVVLHTAGAHLVLLILVSELVLARISDAVSHVFLASDRLWAFSVLSTMPALGKAVAAVVMYGSARSDLAAWVVLYAAAAAVVTGTTIAYARTQFGPWRLSGEYSRSRLKESFLFACGQSAQSALADADKVLLVRLDAADVAGIYAAAYRVLDGAMAPVRAVVYSAYAAFFRAGAKGSRHAASLARGLAPAMLLLCASVSTCLWIGAPGLERILGKEYEGAAAVLRALAIVPLLRGGQYLAGDVLTGSGRQGIRTGWLVVIALANVITGYFLIQRYSWQGAAAATIACEAGLTLAMLAAAWRLVRRNATTPDGARQVQPAA